MIEKCAVYGHEISKRVGPISISVTRNKGQPGRKLFSWPHVHADTFIARVIFHALPRVFGGCQVSA